jgi:RNA polymerase sigma-70 factor, ECF subfamily
MEPNRTTFTALYERYAPEVHRFAYWLSGSAEDAADITSETFVRVWTSEQPIRELSVKAYLFTIARRLYLQQRRKGSRVSALSEDYGGVTRQTEQLTEDRSELDHVFRAMATLPEEDRSILIMRAVEELTHEEIAAATGLSVAAVKVRIFRARVKLTARTTPSKDPV